MVSETKIPAPAGQSAPPRPKYRLRFRKAGNLRLVSHHDLMHVLERMMRRASIPFAVSQGFHPQPKMVFALSLALGVVGLNEVLEIELKEHIPADEVLCRLNRCAPAGLEFLSIREQPAKVGARVRRAFYRLPLDETPADLPERINSFLADASHWVVRMRPNRRRINIRPYVSDLSLRLFSGEPKATADRIASTDANLSTVASGSPLNELLMTLWITPTGAVRPEEVATALGLAPLLEAGAVLERTHLELLDEVPEHERFVPDLAAAGEASAAPPETPNDALASDDERPRSHAPTSLVSNPLSFDS
jgi:radical SAM-linked protein